MIHASRQLPRFPQMRELLTSPTRCMAGRRPTRRRLQGIDVGAFASVSRSELGEAPPGLKARPVADRPEPSDTCPPSRHRAPPRRMASARENQCWTCISPPNAQGSYPVVGPPLSKVDKDALFRSWVARPRRLGGSRAGREASARVWKIAVRAERTLQARRGPVLMADL
jgi:hypothetical protein